MSWFPSPATPGELIADLKAFARGRSPHQWFAAAAALAMTLGILFIFYMDSKDNIGPGEQLIYVESWRADRSDEEIKAAQAERQKDKETQQKARQQMFKDLERKFGM